ncbi:hypothetical protein G4Y79_23265 [Phototrophicus methaneseepsis]|uniref:Uncharacterized protein n=1 Tax=Phototrophicus methaneseepsis TaxID=2710758 RepID=A0A7S8IEH1_9CHLR|nr:hypothetical protein [Phototrophicus methaneseepsis]QPC82572.1 hypothetical protein G4Y79_23265 [Phototrophicus methaneseepsis]
MVLGLVCFVLFMVMVCVLALIFVSFDAPSGAKKVLTQHFPAVRKINTTTIETVDETGQKQQWQRLG